MAMPREIVTEVIDRRHLGKKRRAELEPLVQGYLNEINDKDITQAHQFFRHITETPFKMVVARLDGKPIGFSLVSKQGTGHHLYGSFVEKKYRGLGLASKLALKEFYLLRFMGVKKEDVIDGLPVTKNGQLLVLKQKKLKDKVWALPAEGFKR